MIETFKLCLSQNAVVVMEPQDIHGKNKSMEKEFYLTKENAEEYFFLNQFFWAKPHGVKVLSDK